MADPHNFKGLLEGQRSPCMMSLLLTTKQQAAPPPPVWNCHECASKCTFWVSWEGPLGGGLAAAGWAQLNPLLGAAPELLERQPAGGSRGLWTGQPGHQPASSLPSAAAALDDPSAAEDDSDSDSNGAKELLAPSACISFMPPAGPGLASTSSAPQGLCLRRNLLVSFHSSSRRCGKMQAANDKEGRKKMVSFHVAATSTKELRPHPAHILLKGGGASQCLPSTRLPGRKRPMLFRLPQQEGLGEGMWPKFPPQRLLTIMAKEPGTRLSQADPHGRRHRQPVHRQQPALGTASFPAAANTVPCDGSSFLL